MRLFWAVAVLAVAACDDGPATGEIAPGPDYAAPIVQTCENDLSKVNCACFWDKVAAAINAGNAEPIRAALAERQQWGGRITTYRLQQAVGDSVARTINQALYRCTEM